MTWRMPPRRWLAVLAAGLLFIIAVGLATSPKGAVDPLQRARRSGSVGATCDQWLDLDRAGGRRIPICANVDLEATVPGIRRLIVVIHGDNRNGPDYFRYVDDVVRQVPSAEAVVVAPQFLTRGDVTRAGLPDNTAYWSSDGWKEGADAAGPAADPPLSSFDVADRIIRFAADATRYPDLRDFVVVGHSAGGQFVNRYGAVTPVDRELEARGIGVRYVVANPSSYLYLDNRRFDSEGRLERPRSEVRDGCPAYDRYKYGLNRPNRYVSDVPSELIVEQLRERHFVYGLGQLDTDPNAESIDSSCAARLQGSDRFARGMNYFRYIGELFGPGAYATHTLVVVPGVGHDGEAMLQSTALRPWILGAAAP